MGAARFLNKNRRTNSMSKVTEITAKVNELAGGEKCVDVFAYAKDGQFGEITVAYELCGADEQILVYDGRINTNDPGEGPLEEYGSREEAIGSERGECFRVVFDLADGIK